MNAKFLIMSIILFAVTGCKTDREIKLIPASEIYFPHTELDKPPEFISKDPHNQNKELSDLVFMINDIYQKLPKAKQENFILRYNFLVNEEGMIDKIQIIKSEFPDVDQKIANVIKEWKFEPGLKDGQKVKFSLPWSYDPKDQVGKIPMKSDTEEIYYIAAEEMPEPIGGLKAIQDKIKYPEEAKKNGIEGKVFVQVFIDEVGNVVKTKVIKGVGHGLDEVAVNAIKQTKFIPGKHEGKPVKVQVVVPINFKLQ